MGSYVLVRKAGQAAATRDAPRTIGLAQIALQHGRRLTSRGRAVALQQLAVGYALAGDEVACQRALDTAAQLAERSQQDQDEGPGRYCTPAYVEIQRAATWIELAGPSAPSTCLTTAWQGCHQFIAGIAVSTLPGSPRHMPSVAAPTFRCARGGRL